MPMESFSTDIAHWQNQLRESGESWAEFFDCPSLSLGVYTVPAGTDDRESHTPHVDEEVYFVVSGKGKLNVAGESIEIRPGGVHYVPSGVEHFFCDVAEDLTLFVVFAKDNS